MRLLVAFLFLSFAVVAQEDTPSISATTWQIVHYGIEIETSDITFLPDGTFTDSRLDIVPGDQLYVWKQKGKKVVFSYNGAYSTFKGKISGDHIKGKTRNKAGKHWTWEAQLVK